MSVGDVPGVLLTDPAEDTASIEVRTAARRFLDEHIPLARVRELAGTEAGFDRDDWQRMIAMGWSALGLPEAAGGTGGGPVQQCVLFEELGRALAGGPLVAGAGYVVPLLAACSGTEAAELIGRVLTGQVLAAFADGTGGRVEATSRIGGGQELSGLAEMVLDAQNADEIVVACDILGGPALVAVAAGAPGVEVEPVAVVDRTRRFARVRLTGATGHRLRVVSEARLASAREVQCVFHAAQMAGVAVRALELLAEHLRARPRATGAAASRASVAAEQRLAEVAVAVSLTRELVFAAADLVEREAWADLGIAARAALARTAAVCTWTTGEALRLRGAAEPGEQHDVDLYHLRALTDRDRFGAPVDLREEIAVAVGL